jgi:hypothetical protein
MELQEVYKIESEFEARVAAEFDGLMKEAGQLSYKDATL